MFIYGLYAINSAGTNNSETPSRKSESDIEMSIFHQRPKSYSICGQNHVIDSVKNLINSKSLSCLVKSVKNDEQKDESLYLDQRKSCESEEIILKSKKYKENLLIFERNVENLSKKAELEQLESFIFNSYEPNSGGSLQTNSEAKIISLLQKRRHTTFFQNNSPLKQSMGLLTVNEENLHDNNDNLDSLLECQEGEKSSRKFSIIDMSKRLFKNFTFNGRPQTRPKFNSPQESKSSTRKNSRTSYNELVDRYYLVRKKKSSLGEVQLKK